MVIIKECCYFLTQNATGVWYESFRMLDKQSDSYIHPIQRGMILLRVELRIDNEDKRAFYWIYNIKDVISFNEYVGINLKGECHEILITNKCRMFYDIDLKVDEIQKHDIAEYMNFELTETNERLVMVSVAERLSDIFKEATIISLEEHGIDIEQELSTFDWMTTIRNRPLENDGYKISLHLLTNIMVPVKLGAAILKHVKYEVIPNNTCVLDIHENIIDMICESIDTSQCRSRGSLSLPYGTKRTKSGDYINAINKDYDIPNQYYFLTLEDEHIISSLDLSQYKVEMNISYADANPSFVKRALDNINNISDYSPRVWDINSSILKRSTMYVKRRASSMCSMCNRIHDNDNTLFLIFNSQRGIASWKCVHNEVIPPQIFYSECSQTESGYDEDELKAFLKKKTKKKQTVQHNISFDNDDLTTFAKKKKTNIQTIPDVLDPLENKKSYVNKHARVVLIKQTHIQLANQTNFNEDVLLYESDEETKQTTEETIRVSTTKKENTIDFYHQVDSDDEGY